MKKRIHRRGAEDAEERRGGKGLGASGVSALGDFEFRRPILFLFFFRLPSVFLCVLCASAVPLL